MTDTEYKSLFEQVKSVYLDDLNHRYKMFMRLENLNIPLMSYSNIIYALGSYEDPNIEDWRLEAQIKELRDFVAYNSMFPYLNSAFHEYNDPGVGELDASFLPAPNSIPPIGEDNGHIH